MLLQRHHDGCPVAVKCLKHDAHHACLVVILLAYVALGTDAWRVDLSSVGFIRTQSPYSFNKKKSRYLWSSCANSLDEPDDFIIATPPPYVKCDAVRHRLRDVGERNWQ
jgi:hypothetical protein